MGRKNQYFPQSVSHPGATLAEKLEEMGMGPKEFAVRTGKPEKTIAAVLKGQSSITPGMAVQFENVTRIPAHFWMNYQKGYDEYVAREKQKATIEAATEWTRSFPVAEMTRHGWIPGRTTIKEKTAELLTFFGVANHKAWEEYYFNQQLKVAFRISLASTSQPYAISAWLRKGELQAAGQQAKPYSAKVFKDALPEIKKVMAAHPSDLFGRLQSLCAAAGVKVVHTPCLPKAPISGCTRWLNDTPLIQLTGRYKRNDSFWFTFFHEAGHILLHRKKDVFLESVEYDDKDLKKEKEADKFAIEWTLSAEQEKEIAQTAPLNDKMIREFAKKFNTHPAIIVGRLQHGGLMPQFQGQQFLEKVEYEACIKAEAAQRN